MSKQVPERVANPNNHCGGGPLSGTKNPTNGRGALLGGRGTSGQDVHGHSATQSRPECPVADTESPRMSTPGIPRAHSTCPDRPDKPIRLLRWPPRPLRHPRATTFDPPPCAGPDIHGRSVTQSWPQCRVAGSPLPAHGVVGCHHLAYGEPRRVSRPERCAGGPPLPRDRGDV